MNWSVKRRYVTILGRAGDNEIVTLRIIWLGLTPSPQTDPLPLWRGPRLIEAVI